MQSIVKRNGLIDGSKFVKAVVSFEEHVERPVDFGVGVDVDGDRHLVACLDLSLSCFDKRSSLVELIGFSPGPAVKAGCIIYDLAGSIELQRNDDDLAECPNHILTLDSISIIHPHRTPFATRSAIAMITKIPYHQTHEQAQTTGHDPQDCPRTGLLPVRVFPG
jgi:hypothetical protein